MANSQALNKEIMRLAFPSILANITVPLVGIVDTMIVGHISNAGGIGGIAIGTMLFDLLYWNFGFLRAGTGGMTAQSYGRKDEANCYSILNQSISISLCATAIIWLLQWPFFSLVMHFIPCSKEVYEIAHQYFFIRIWAAPATLSLMAIKGWFIGMQNTRAPMAIDLIVNGVNILASWLLAMHTPLKIAGVAYGTVIAQYSGLIAASALLIFKHQYHSHIHFFKKSKDYGQLMKLNGNLFIRSLCFMIVYVGFTSLCSKYGDDQLAVGSIMMKLFMLFSYFVDGFAYAGEALTGRFYGEKNENSLRVAVKILFAWTTGIGILFTLLYGIGGDWCIQIMTSDITIQNSAQPLLFWLFMMPILSCYAFMWDGIYIGAAAGKEIRDCMILAAIGFVIGYLIFNHSLGVQAIYIGYFLHLVIRALYLSLQWKKYSRI